MIIISKQSSLKDTEKIEMQNPGRSRTPWDQPIIYILFFCLLLSSFTGCRLFRRDSAISSVDKQRIIEQADRAANRGDLEHANELLTKASRESPDDPDIHWHLAIIMEKLNDDEGALRELRACALLSPHDCRGYRQMAKLMYEQKKYKPALTLANEALSHDPYDIESLLILARITRDQNQVDNAKGYYQRALGHALISPEIELEVADYYLSLNQQEQAGPLLREIVTHKELDTILLASAWWKLGNMYESLGRWADSSHAYQNSLALNDERTPAELERVGLVLAMNGDHQLAEEVMRISDSKIQQPGIQSILPVSKETPIKNTSKNKEPFFR